MTAIIDIIGREILDSRGNPTVEVDVILEDGSFGRAAVPSGASTGVHEAVELRDGDKSRYGGKGVLQGGRGGQRRDLRRARRPGRRGAGQDRRHHDRARRHPQQGPARRQRHPRRLARRRQGGGQCRAACRSTAMSAAPRRALLPVPMMNIINGGVHADNPIDFQEFMIMPVGAPSFAEALRAGSEIFHTLKGQLKAAGHNTNVGDEGGFAPNLPSAEAALDFIVQGDREGRLQAGRRRHARARSGGERILQGRRLCLWRRGQDALARRAGRLSRRA